TLSGNGVDDTGTYSFRLLAAPRTDGFAIAYGDTVSVDVPGPGAGDIEEAGATDVYTFEGDAGRTVSFDVLAGDSVFIHWALVAPDGSVLFDTFIGDAAPVPPADGTPTLTLGGNGVDDTGTYSFQLLAVPRTD